MLENKNVRLALKNKYPSGLPKAHSHFSIARRGFQKTRADPDGQGNHRRTGLKAVKKTAAAGAVTD
ncbi:hypothetical protein DWY99_13320 [[Clostridium] leptum]|uniref:Uncharacterized protein n=1 Tax=[Clostridium] leptum TaxID=1535 RepID=A0A412AUJ2_9FIRM|nr:hypothetical protein DWY99_13320 [[Clostridium] leptum]